MMLGRKRRSRRSIQDSSDSLSDRTENPPAIASSSEEQTSSLSSQQSLVDYSPRHSQPSKLSTRKNTLEKSKSRNARSSRRLYVDSTSSTPDTVQENQIHLRILDEKTNIYHYVKNGTPINEIVNEWIQEYKLNKKDAVLLLIQFIMDSIGCKKFVTHEMYDNPRLMKIIDEEFCFTEDGKYHLLRYTFEWKEFCDNFSQFMHILIEECYKSEIIYDAYFIDKFIHFLIKSSGSHFQGLRHTTTLAALKIISSLIKILKSLRRSSSDISQSESDVENSRIIHELIVKLIDKVFALRFVDSIAKIRSICMQELDFWFQAIPELFVKDDFLKYIGRSISDGDPEVRLICLEILQPLYNANDMKEKLHDFNKKFKERLVYMTLDVNFDVGVLAMKIVIEILKKDRQVLSIANYEYIFKLVFERHQPLARLAGKFLQIYISNSSSSDNDSMTSDASTNTTLIRDLVVFFHEADTPQFADLFVDAMIDEGEVLKDWNLMTNLLLEDEISLDKDVVTTFVVIMVSSIKQAATGELPIYRESTQKVTASVKKQIKNDQEIITKHFIEILPDLIVKYKQDFGILAQLLLIPKYFDLNIYTKFRKQEQLDLLLVEIQALIETTEDLEVLKNAIQVLYNLCTEGYAIFNSCDTVRSRIIDGIIQTYKKNVEDLSIANASGDSSAESFSKITEDLKKIAYFYTSFDLNSWEIWDSLLNHIVDALSIKSEKSIPVEAVKYCLMALHNSILYDRRHMKDWIDSDSQIEDRCNLLREHLDTYMAMMIDLITEENVKTPVDMILKNHSHSSFCDLSLIFSDQLKSHPNPLMHSLVYEIDSRAEKAIYVFLLENVFIRDETKNRTDDPSISIERLNKRRKFLANYCKLITYNIIPTKSASHMFTYYDVFNKEYGDLFKDTLTAAMNISRVNCALTILHSLMILFNELKDEDGLVNSHSRKFTKVQELAKKFVALFGTSVEKNKEAMVALHRAGIKFSFVLLEGETIDLSTPSSNLSFLKILSEFANKLTAEDKITMVEFLDKELDWDIKFLKTEKWSPLKHYRGLLDQGKTKEAGKRDKNSGSKKQANRKSSTPARKEPLNITRTRVPKKTAPEYSAPLTEISNLSLNLSPTSTIDNASNPSTSTASNLATTLENEHSELMECSPIESAEDEYV